MGEYHRSKEWAKISAREHARTVLPTPCWRCGRMIQPGQKYHIGHLIDVAAGGQGGPTAPEHIRCNTRSGGRLGAQITNRKKTRGEYPTW